MIVDRERILKGIQNIDDKQVAARVLDGIQYVIKEHSTYTTDFLDPHERQLAISIISQIQDIGYMLFGGYRRAERQVMVILPEYFLRESVKPPITSVEISGNFGTEELTHRGYLGAVMGLGVRREKFGDIIVGKNGCQLVLMKDIVEYVLTNLKTVGRYGVRVVEIDTEQLNVEPERVKEITDTVASLRLDSVAGSGFSTSRSQMVKDIKAGNVKLNWQQVTDPSREVKEGDIISIRGRGRVVLETVMGESKKGRIRVFLKRYM
jgi:RNA-binding protein YlmH